jgi:signal transduction histidine kinase/ligand-binding sensor domain-containing protein
VLVALPLVAAGSPSVPAQGDAASSDYRVVRWTTAEGLPQNTVSDIAILPSGEMWLATFGGLARFDGEAFRTLDIAADAQMPANRVIAVVPRGDESFLFLTQEGHLGRVERGQASRLVPPPAVPHEALQLLVTPDGRIWSRASDGRIWQTDGSRPWAPMAGDRTGGDPIRTIALDTSGDLWAGTHAALIRVTGPSPAAAFPIAGGVTAIAARHGGGLWLASTRRLGVVRGADVRWIDVDPPFTAPISAIASAHEDSIWVATRGEIVRVDVAPQGASRRTRLPVDLPQSFPVRTLVQDPHGSLWVGTAGAGLYRVNRFPSRHVVPGLGAVGGLVSDGRGGAFIAAGCGTLFHLDVAGSVHAVNHGEPQPPCQLALARGGDGSLWVRAGRRLVRLGWDPEDVQVVTIGLPHEEGPLAPALDGRTWAVSRSGVVELLSAQGQRLRSLTLPAPLGSASLGPDGALWVGGESEVFRVVDGTTTRIGASEGAPRGQVRDIVTAEDGTTWFGTYGGGLGRWRNGKVSTLTTAHGLPDNSISRLLVDRRRRMWISTNRGVAVIDMEVLDAVADGRAKTLLPVVLGVEHGIPEANFGSPAGFVDDADRVWLGTIDGAVVVDGGALPFDSTPPAIRVEEIRADDRVLSGGPVVGVPPLTNRLRLRFTTFELTYPELVRFRYRIENVDADWVNLGASRFVDWTPPAPGRYRFLVEARNADGVWSTGPATAVLDVLPAWWQTGVFRLSATVALIVAAVAAVGARIRSLQRHHAARLRVVEEQRQAEAQIAQVRAQLDHVARAALAGELGASIAHEVRQPIGAMVNNAEAGRRHLAHYLQHPDELEQLLDDIVADGMRASAVVQGLRGFLQPKAPEATAIDMSALVREMLPLVRRELEEHRVTLELALDEQLPAVDGYAVQLGQIVANLVINACEALAGVEGPRRLTISTSAAAGRVELAVTDNGPGLRADVAARAFDPFVTTKPDGLGVGLAICRSIAERHGGHLGAEAAPGGGVRMVLTLPAARDGAARS